MKAKITSMDRDYVDVSVEGRDEKVPTRFTVELMVTELPETLEQVSGWFKDGVEFDLVPKGDMVPVVRMGGLAPAFYHADEDDEPDAYLIPVPEE